MSDLHCISATSEHRHAILWFVVATIACGGNQDPAGKEPCVGTLVDASTVAHPLDGCWEQSTAVGSEEGMLSIENGKGRASVYFFLGPPLYRADFDVIIEPAPTSSVANEETENSESSESGTDVPSPPTSFVFIFECDRHVQGPCAELDFRITCSVGGQLSRTLTCGQATGVWPNYPFGWEEQL